MNSTFECFKCLRAFLSKSGLSKHLRTAHSIAGISSVINYDRSVYTCKCIEEGCNSSFQNRKLLIAHLEMHHKKTFELMKIEFSSEEEFMGWKMHIEKEFNVKYNTRGPRKDKKEYFYCNRSGFAKGRSCDREYKRQLKAQGSIKLNAGCTSRLDVQRLDGAVKVTWIKTHYGHSEKEIKHVPIPKLDKLTIASKLILGVTPTRILSSVRRDLDMLNPKRVDFLKRKDISNLQSTLHLTSTDGKRHENDAISVDLFPVLERKKIGFEQVRNFAALVTANLMNSDLSNFDQDVLDQIYKNYVSVQALTNYVKPKMDFVQTAECEATAKKLKIDPQLRFQTTKKQRVSTKTALKYPEKNEAEEIKNCLLFID